MLKKTVKHAFSKDVFLIGIESDGTYVWLENKSFDCGWYWGFGYLETYTNNKQPQNSKDIDSHRHWNTIELDKIIEWTITEDELAEVKILFDEFYVLRKKCDKEHNVNEDLYNSLIKETELKIDTILAYFK